MLMRRCATTSAVAAEHPLTLEKLGLQVAGGGRWTLIILSVRRWQRCRGCWARLEELFNELLLSPMSYILRLVVLHDSKII